MGEPNACGISRDVQDFGDSDDAQRLRRVDVDDHVASECLRPDMQQLFLRSEEHPAEIVCLPLAPIDRGDIERVLAVRRDVAILVQEVELPFVLPVERLVQDT